jgi:uncharacterized protein
LPLLTPIEIKLNIRLSRDANDDHVIALAIDANADYLITSDLDLLVLKSIGKIRIVTMRQFLDFMATK